MDPVLNALHHKLVVSCQADPDDPMDDAETLSRVARSAALGGAAGFRLNSPEHIRAVRTASNLPVIGIQKSYVGGRLRITPDFDSAADLAEAGADIIALDCTDRVHAYGEPWREIVQRIRDELSVLVMADVATLHEGVAAAESGADIIATTLNGYTEATKDHCSFEPELVRSLVRVTNLPVFAEGHINTPQQANLALSAGAWCVVVGSAITRPAVITASFVSALRGLE